MLERTLRHSFYVSLTALATARDHELALQRRRETQAWSRRPPPLVQSVLYGSLHHSKNQEAIQNHTQQSKNANILFQTNKLWPFPLSNEHRSLEKKKMPVIGDGPEWSPTPQVMPTFNIFIFWVWTILNSCVWKDWKGYEKKLCLTSEVIIIGKKIITNV